MEATIDGVKYTINPTPPSVSPYSTLVVNLLEKEPKDLEDAEQLKQQIEKGLDAIFAETVTRKPKKEHYILIYDAVIKVTQQTLKQAELFRLPTEFNAQKSGSDSTPNP